jgi:hypothetical protein
MNMLAGMLGGLIDKEQMIYDTIQTALENVAEELGCTHKDFFVMIRPMNEDYDFKLFICKYDENGNPMKVREMMLKEILS